MTLGTLIYSNPGPCTQPGDSSDHTAIYRHSSWQVLITFCVFSSYTLGKIYSHFATKLQSVLHSWHLATIL